MRVLDAVNELKMLHVLLTGKDLEKLEITHNVAELLEPEIKDGLGIDCRFYMEDELDLDGTTIVLSKSGVPDFSPVISRGALLKWVFAPQFKNQFEKKPQPHYMYGGEIHGEWESYGRG